MNTAFLERSKQTLERRRSNLLRLYLDTAQREQALRTEVEPDWPDQAKNLEVDRLLLQLSERERSELAEIDAALARIAVGRYGRCEQCGGSIGTQRLVALPETSRCVRCASESSFARVGHG